jgi:hypothetical protein
MPPPPFATMVTSNDDHSSASGNVVLSWLLCVSSEACLRGLSTRLWTVVASCLFLCSVAMLVKCGRSCWRHVRPRQVLRIVCYPRTLAGVVLILCGLLLLLEKWHDRPSPLHIATGNSTSMAMALASGLSAHAIRNFHTSLVRHSSNTRVILFVDQVPAGMSSGPMLDFHLINSSLPEPWDGYHPSTFRWMIYDEYLQDTLEVCVTGD